ncbi:hypothetical protein KGD83_11885 [Nocardiopsis akebiae]|uniref:TPR repeat domain-containing protein n=1 Tax=Nocardiopsis akebiae TaxID=2831968 RepID=A0ABX8CAQ7_9ACTN|nr:hypothetical protein [Nocardiopsis akebiae]QUX31122.1 hypothetical protein KGD83_11885 [Nocardiopsis akebiae]
MATFDLSFEPRSTTANPEAIRTRAEELTILQARLLGRSDDLTGQFNSTATQFTDLLAWNVKGLSEEDYQYWRDAGVAITYAASKLEEWAQHVEEFKDEREAQNTEWFDFRTKKEGEIPADFQGQTITAAHPERGGVFGISDASKCRDIYDEVAAKLTELQERERTNYRNFEEHADEVAADLGEGPTKANVQALIDAGINSWAFYNLDPNRYTMLVDGQELTEENAQEWADQLSSYWSGDKPLDENYHELMLMMSMVTTNAMQAQQGGTGYRSEEMDFLDVFYDELERSQPGGVIDIPASMEGDHLTDEEREHALGVLGDGLLALSDPHVGGGYYDLPPSVREAAEGPHLTPSGSTPPSSHAWAEDARSLAAMLGNAHESMEPGYTLSMTLSLSMGMYSDEYSAVMDQFIPEDDVLSLMDVANRNEDAMHDLFAGAENEDGEREPYVHPNLMGTYHGEEGQFQRFSPHTEQWGSPEEMINTAVEGLFTHPWEDNGETVGDMIEWIAQDAHSQDQEERDRAGRAAAGFVEMITTAEMHEALTNTGVDIEGTDYSNASFTAFNTELADNLADIFDAYIFGFAHSDPSETSVALDEDGNEMFDESGEPVEEEIATTGVGNYDSEHNWFEIGLEERLSFMEYLMGNDDTAVRTIGSASTYQGLLMETYLETGDQYAAGRGSATLSSLIDNALLEESGRRQLDQQEAHERKEMLYGLSLETSAELASGIPVIGESLSQGLGLGAEWLTGILAGDEPVVSPRLPIGQSDESNRSEQRIMILEHILNSRVGNFESPPPQEYIDILIESGAAERRSDGSMAIDIDSEVWQDEGHDAGEFDDLDDVVASALENTTFSTSDRGLKNGQDMAGAFGEAYGDRHKLIDGILNPQEEAEKTEEEGEAGGG